MCSRPYAGAGPACDGQRETKDVHITIIQWLDVTVDVSKRASGGWVGRTTIVGVMKENTHAPLSLTNGIGSGLDAAHVQPNKLWQSLTQ